MRIFLHVNGAELKLLTKNHPAAGGVTHNYPTHATNSACTGTKSIYERDILGFTQLQQSTPRNNGNYIAARRRDDGGAHPAGETHVPPRNRGVGVCARARNKELQQQSTTPHAWWDPTARAVAPPRRAPGVQSGHPPPEISPPREASSSPTLHSATDEQPRLSRCGARARATIIHPPRRARGVHTQHPRSRRARTPSCRGALGVVWYSLSRGGGGAAAHLGRARRLLRVGFGVASWCCVLVWFGSFALLVRGVAALAVGGRGGRRPRRTVVGQRGHGGDGLDRELLRLGLAPQAAAQAWREGTRQGEMMALH